MKKIIEIAKKINLKENDLFFYGKYKAKIEKLNNENNNGKLVLITSINPTPYGEGKTTLSIGLCDSLNKLGYTTIADLREPSLGPVFGRKGGAIGGGKALLEPSDDINLHFNGDFHAITSANNLLCAIVDNHIFQGNELGIERVIIKRCIDINDRSLRDNFVITPASELMAIVCLSKDINDLKKRISNIIVGYTKENKEIYVKDLNAEESVTILLKDAIKPNLVQTAYNNPVIVHGGPFANIAHGCSSLIGTKTSLLLSDYTITEAGFGSDLGGIKFFDIKSRIGNIYPDVVVINASIKALKYNGKGNLKDGISNLEYHILNMKKFNDNVIVALNKFDDDSLDEIKLVKQLCNNLNTEFSVCEMYQNGDDGCIELSNKIINLKENKKRYFVYDLNDTLEEKIYKMCKMFGASKIIYKDNTKKLLSKLNNYKLPICIAKTPMSITDDSKILGYPKDFSVTVTDIKLYNGAGFIVIYMGNIITMPGLSKNSNYLSMKIENGKIYGIK